MTIVDKIIEKIKNSNKIAICGHINSDGDSIGSCLALSNALYVMGKNPIVYLDGTEIKYDSAKGREFISNETNIDLFISVDTAALDRLSHHKELFEKSETIVIDHHISNNGYGNLNWIDEEASSTCEMLAFLIAKLVKIDMTIAAWLYTGISTDTSVFSNPNTTPKTLRVSADLIETGIDYSTISFLWNKSRTYNSFKSIGKLKERAIFVEDLGLVYTSVTLDYMKKHEIEERDIESMSTLLNTIEEAKIAISVRESEKNVTRASFRSRSRNIDVSKIAGHFKGGGHINASGCTIEAPPHEAIEQIIRHLRELKICKVF